VGAFDPRHQSCTTLTDFRPNRQFGVTLNKTLRRLASGTCRAGGAMALLCGRVDTSIIHLVGRWRSDVMLRYLHLQAGALTNNLSSTMLRAGVSPHPRSRRSQRRSSSPR
jgi:hypothetical protein